MPPRRLSAPSATWRSRQPMALAAALPTRPRLRRLIPSARLSPPSRSASSRIRLTIRADPALCWYESTSSEFIWLLDHRVIDLSSPLVTSLHFFSAPFCISAAGQPFGQLCHSFVVFSSLPFCSRQTVHLSGLLRDRSQICATSRPIVVLAHVSSCFYPLDLRFVDSLYDLIWRSCHFQHTIHINPLQLFRQPLRSSLSSS